MSHLSLNCPVCHERLRIPEDRAGTVILCPKCEFQWTVPGSQPAAPPQPSAEPAKRETTLAPPKRSQKRHTGSPGKASRRPVETRNRNPRSLLPGVVGKHTAGGLSKLGSGSAPSRELKPFECNLRVIRDSFGLLRGVVRGLITPQGLTLRQKGEQEMVPVGVAASYLGNTTLCVDMEARRLEMSVAQLGCYPQKLAQDLAAYLGGGKKVLRRGDYFLPWYLYAAALLPIGMPAVSLVGSTSSGVGHKALVAAIVGAVAGLLVSLCLFAVQREKWPAALRLLIVSSVTTVGYGVLFLYALLYLWTPAETG